MLFWLRFALTALAVYFALNLLAGTVFLAVVLLLRTLIIDLYGIPLLAAGALTRAYRKLPPSQVATGRRR